MMSEEMKEYKISLLSKDVIGDYYIFNFKKPTELQYKEGQYGIFMHVDKIIEGRKMRAFSMVSSADETVLTIATKIVKEPSDFKAKMLLLNEGEFMSYTGPTGNFTLENDEGAVFIAGGIGITPIRSLLHEIDVKKRKIDVTLIYSEAAGVFPFEEELKAMNIKSFYQTTASATKEAVLKVSSEKKNDVFYYMSGSPGFVSGIQDLLISNGVLKERIKFDRFNGYDTILKIEI